MQPSSPPSDGKIAGSVVLATHEYAPFRGGVATYVREVAAAATRMGLAVEVWTVDYVGRSFPVGQREEAEAGMEKFSVVHLPSNGRLTPRGLLRLAWGFWRRRRKLRDRPVLLLSVGAQMAFFLLDILGQRPGGSVTCLFHGSEIPRFRRNLFWRRLARRFYRRNPRFAATTKYVSDLLRESGLLPAGSPVVRAPCALPETFRRDAEAASRFSIQHDGAMDPATFRVLTVARLHLRKGQLDVARALTLLPEELRARVEYQMVGAGDESYRCEIEAACRAGGVQCSFLGALDDVALGKVYSRATIYAQASRTLPQSVEGFGLTFLEAGIYGCPAAAWCSGGVGEAVRDGETGLLVKEGNVRDLATAIERLLVEPLLRENLGHRAREFAQDFVWNTAAENLCGCPSAMHAHSRRIKQP